jgi:hypothetical protein
MSLYLKTRTRLKKIWFALKCKYHEIRDPYRASLRNLKHQIIKRIKRLVHFTIPLVYNAIIIAGAIKLLNGL